VALPGGFFQRYRASDPDALARSIAQQRVQLAAAQAAGDRTKEAAIACRLGGDLTIAGEEEAAAEILDVAVMLARRLGDAVLVVEALLNLATARQYLGDHASAQVLFQDALDRARATEAARFTHFILHHRGRCYVEQGETAAARRCFIEALALRKALGEKRFIDSTQRALAALDDT
jgi:tetratricopeptide (TPR) repeat protein